MEYRDLGRSGLEVSAVALGAATFGRPLDQTKSTDLVSAALDAGVTLFDTAEAYGKDGVSEAMLGVALAGRREGILIATKFGHPDVSSGGAPGSRANIRRAVEGSLRRLRTDRIDLCYQHFPDPTTPLDETLEALEELVTEGKVLHVCACNVTGDDLRAGIAAAERHPAARYVACQSLLNLLEREAETEILPVCRSLDIGLVAYGPLAKGLLARRFDRDAPVPAGARLITRREKPGASLFDRAEAAARLAERHGLSLVEMAMAWILSRPGVTTTVAGASDTSQFLQTLRAAEAWRRTASALWPS